MISVLCFGMKRGRTWRHQVGWPPGDLRGGCPGSLSLPPLWLSSKARPNFQDRLPLAPSPALPGVGFVCLTWALALLLQGPLSLKPAWGSPGRGPALAPQPSAAPCCPQRVAVSPPVPAGPWHLTPRCRSLPRASPSCSSANKSSWNNHSTCESSQLQSLGAPTGDRLLGCSSSSAIY